MSQEGLVKLKSKSGTVIWTRRGKKSKGAQNTPKLKLKKFDPKTRKREEFIQTK